MWWMQWNGAVNYWLFVCKIGERIGGEFVFDGGIGYLCWWVLVEC